MSKKNKSPKMQLSEKLREMINRAVPIRMLQEVAPELIDELQAGMPVPLVADLIVDKLIKLAIDPKRPNQWALELIWERMEGKAAQGQPPDDQGRLLEERLDDITTQHLNAIATQYAKSHRDGQPAVKEQPLGPDTGNLDLLEDGIDSSQEAGSELGVA